MPLRPCASRLRLAVIALLLVSACSSSETITLAAADLSAYADTDAIVVVDRHRSHLAPPSSLIRDKGKGATNAMGDWAGGLSGGGGDGLAALAGLAIFVVGLPVAAAIGAGSVHSEQEIAAADTAFRAVAADTALLATLGARVADQLRVGVPGHWRCAAAVSDDGDPCPDVARPASLVVEAQYMATATGRYSPEVTLTAMAEARLMRAGAAPAVMRWRYDSEPRPYFELTSHDGAQLRAAVGRMLDALAAAIARDLLLDPKPQEIEVALSGRTGRTGMPVEPPRGVARRMAPNEPLPYAFATAGKAIITTRAHRWGLDSCVIAAIDDRPPARWLDMQRPEDRIRIAPVDPGAHRLTLSCPRIGPENWERRELEVEVEASQVYCTDGAMFAPTDTAFRCPTAAEVAAAENPGAAE